MKCKCLLFLAISASSTALYAQSGNVGIGTTTPATRLDVNGSFRTQPLSPNTNGASGSIPVTTSAFFVANGNWISPLTLPANPSAGQRMVVYSQASLATVINTTNTTLGAAINMVTGEAYEFVGNGSGWQLNTSGASGISGDYDWMKSGNAFPNSPGDTTANIYHIGGNVGMGTNSMMNYMHLAQPGSASGVSTFQGVGSVRGLHMTTSAKPGIVLENLSVASGTRIFSNSVANVTGNGELVWESNTDNGGIISALPIMAMSSSGNVSIGTNVVTTNKFAVNGGASIGSGYVTTAAPANGALIEGKVGIGSTAPSGKLTVSGSGAGFTPALTLINTNVAGNPTLNIYPGYTSSGGGGITEGNQYAVTFDQDPGINTAGASQSLYDFHGQVRYVSATALSDRRLKENISDMKQYGLKEVLKMQPRNYIMKEYKTKDIGFIAQELKQIVPEIVMGEETEKTLLSVDYSKVCLVLINAIKEQQAQIETLKKANTGLKAEVSKIAQLSDELNALKASIEKLTPVSKPELASIK